MNSQPLSSAGQQKLSRRHFLGGAATGLSSIALMDLLRCDGLADDAPQIDPRRPFAPRAAHRAAPAKRVMMVFCAGACSQLETWDYKP